jgi:hypothetical protein
MTDLTPTPKQLQSWIDKICYPHEQGVGPSLKDKELASLAFKAGADQQLEADCEWLTGQSLHLDGSYLRAARRPEPPSLKEQALKTVDKMSDCMSAGFVPMRRDLDTIRRALEALPND